jgi:hypothetical protein
MPRLTNSATNVVVNVSDETAARLGSEWVADGDAPAKRGAPGRPKKAESSDKK